MFTSLLKVFSPLENAPAVAASRRAGGDPHRPALMRHDEAARGQPAAYRRRVVVTAMALLVLPVGAFAIFMGGLAGFSIAHFAGLSPVALALVMLAAMIVAGAIAIVSVARILTTSAPPADARAVTRGDAPALFDCIDQVQRAAAGPVMDAVFIDNSLDASVDVMRRFGFFGAPSRWMIIGLPLMQALTVDQFKAVIAHEYGHVVSTQDKTVAAIYQWRALFLRLRDVLHVRRGAGDGLFARACHALADRIVPFFDRLTKPLAREAELNADAVAAKLVSGQTTADALLRLHLAARYVSDVFWPSVDKHARTCAQPNVAPLRHAQKAFARMRTWPRHDAWMREILARETDPADAHPGVAERIRAMQAAPRLAPLASVAASSLLGARYDQLRSDFDTDWRRDVAARWQSTHEGAQQALKRLSELDQVADFEPLDPALAVERAVLADENIGREAALMRYKEALAWDDGNARAWLAVGSILAAQGNERALKCLTRAGALADHLRLAAMSKQYQYYAATGDVTHAARLMDDIRTEEERHRTAHEQIGQIARTDTLAPHALGADQLRAIGVVLTAFGSYKNAFLLRKHADHLPALFGYHLVLVPEVRKVPDRAEMTARLKALGFAPADAPLFIRLATGPDKWLARFAEEIDGASVPLPGAHDGAAMQSAA